MGQQIRGTCGVSLGLFRGACAEDAVALCVYCNRPFCPDHGLRAENHTDTCFRKICRKKVIDLAAHLEWKEKGDRSNRVSHCARSDCEVRMNHQCSRCKLLFCGRHVVSARRATAENSNLGANQTGLPVGICEHCRRRARLWSD